MTGGINSLTINPTSTVAICGGASGGIRAVNLIQGTVLAQMKGHEEGSSIESIQFSEIQTGTGPKSVEVIVSVGTDARVCIWEAGNFKLRSTGLHEDAVTSLAFPRALSNPHAAPTALNTTFITASADKTLKLWDYRTGLCLQTFLGHSDAIHSCAISSDGKIIVSGGEDGLGKSFEVGRQGEGHLGNN
jgi:ribosome assembly protein SQT1